jgi:hypothetical protein
MGGFVPEMKSGDVLGHVDHRRQYAAGLESMANARIDILLRMTLMLSAGLALWVVYRFMQGDIMIILANAIATALAVR